MIKLWSYGKKEIETKNSESLNVSEECFDIVMQQEGALYTGVSVVSKLLESDKVIKYLESYLNNYQGNKSLFLRLSNWQYIHPKKKFRVFISNKRITAVSQRYPYFCYTKVPNKIDIKNFYLSIRESLPFENLIMDLYLSKKSIKIIDFKPFHTSIDPALFNWKSDFSLLTEGISMIDFELRYVKSPEDQLHHTLPIIKPQTRGYYIFSPQDIQKINNLFLLIPIVYFFNKWYYSR